MTKEDPRPDGNEQDSTPDKERESEEASEDLEKFLSDDSEDDSQEDSPISRKELKRLEKGIKILATKIGRENKAEPKEAKSETSAPIVYAEELLTIKHPEAELVMDELQEEAKRTGKDVLSVWKGSTFFKNEAKARAEAKKAEEVASQKVGDPSLNVKQGPIPFNRIDLDNQEHVKWLKADPKRMEQFSAYMAENSLKK